VIDPLIKRSPQASTFVLALINWVSAYQGIALGLAETEPTRWLI
jgi:hypothetical protein